MLDLELLHEGLNQLRGKLCPLVGHYFSWNTKTSKDIFIQEICHYLLYGPRKGFSFNPLAHIIHADQDIILTFRSQSDRPNIIESLPFKRLDQHLRLEWHFISLNRFTHPLTSIIAADKFLCILKYSRPIITGMQYLVYCPLICKVASTWFIMACLQYVINFILTNTSSYDQIWASSEKVSSYPRIVST